MRSIRMAAAALVILLMISLTGCYNATYSFNFSTEQDTSNEEGAWIIDGEGVAGINDYGYYSNGLWLTAPYVFRDDFKLTAHFWLGVTAEDSGYVEVALTDVPPAPGGVNDWVSIQLLDLATENERLYVEDGHLLNVATPYNVVEQIPGLNRGHWNEITLTKKGANIKFTVNDRSVASFELVNCASEYLAISFVSGCDVIDDPTNPKTGFILKDVKVEYTQGNAELII
ncbi:MAG TPA: hypothetical protein PLI88_06660 [Bacillota bacterium]|nr:hypothetical protein [Bacillota bacterium]HOH09913.1 hypothetical protein [Bacillota bacterium]HOY88949.1 hypothetical protein [Bacillota bacterium]HPI01805.1 hypothetical protein [Bacillota bacterium]HPM63390.1 hypothetical protein [Bacillota bacterium]